MKTSVIEVRGMLSVLSVDEVERRTGEVPGVESVTVNFAAANATVRYDETQLEIADVKSTVRQRGYDPAEPATSAPAELKAVPASSTAANAPAPAGDAPQGKPAQSPTSESPPAEPPAAPAPTADASKPPDASAAPDEKPDKAAPDKS